MRSLVLVLLITSLSACTRVDVGHVGVKVNYAGSDRGVDDYPPTTGWVFYNPFSSTVFEYPTFVQTAQWTANETEGSDNNEELCFNSQEGLVVCGDISLSYQLIGEKVPAFYVKFRNDDLGQFTHGFLRNIARDSFNEEASRFPVDDLYGSRKEEFLAAVKSRVNSQVEVIGVQIEQFGFIGAMRLPDSVVNALNSKIAATQKAIQAENELRQAEAEAQKAVAKARGEAQSNEILTRSLTPQLLEWRQLDILQGKWDGKYPQYVGGDSPVPMISVGGR